jgi:hypothetical protein
MKTMKLLPLLLLLALPAVVQAQFTFTTNNGAITITGYTGNPTVLNIPSAINGWPVVSIGDNAFTGFGLTSVTIPNSVTNIGMGAFCICFGLTSVTIGNGVIYIGMGAFTECTGLTNITMDALNTVYCSVNGVVFNKSTNTLIRYPGGKMGSFTIPNSVTSIGSDAFDGCSGLTNLTIGTSVTNIGSYAFFYCYRLTNVTIGINVTSIGDYAFSRCWLTKVTIPNSVTSIGSYAFFDCAILTGIYFQGDAPGAGTDWTVFSGEYATGYYLSGKTGWGSWFDGLPMVLWNPQAQTGGTMFGVRTNRFGFNITGSSNLVIVVEGCTNLANPDWRPVSINMLNTFIGTNGTSYFSDSDWTNYPGRFYRLRSP